MNDPRESPIRARDNFVIPGTTIYEKSEANRRLIEYKAYLVAIVDELDNLMIIDARGVSDISDVLNRVWANIEKLRDDVSLFKVTN